MRAAVLRFYQSLFEEEDPAKLQSNFLDLLMEIQNVERGSLWVKTEAGYHCLLAAGDESAQVQGVTIDPGRPSIVGWVIENGRMTIAEAGKDQRHYKEMERGLALKSNLILCFPLILSDGSIYGALQVIDTSAEGDRLNLDPEYLELLQTMVDLGSLALSRTMKYLQKRDENRRLRQALAGIRQPGTIVGRDRAFRQVLQRASGYARTDFPVLITGESGTGKEILAREIHRLSSRRDGPFLVQNCSAIPDTLLESELFGYTKGAFTGAVRDKVGLFQAAHGGTVFLDEIGDMPLNLQARILRVLQNQEVKPLGATRVRRVDVRIVSATHQDLARIIAQGRFRQDLFFRLNVLPLALPPLRQRPGDIPLLLDYFMRREARRMGVEPRQFSPPALDRLLAYQWPGNIRELENTVKYVLAAVAGRVVEAGDLPAQIRAESPPRSSPDGHPAAPAAPPRPPEGLLALEGRSWQEVDRAYVLYLLEKNQWNVTRAARQAGLKRSTFDSRLRKMGIRKNQ